MITPSFTLTATERVLPKLALDFTTASLDARVTFTRSGNNATVTNSSGYVVPINANLPRFDYDPVTLACKGLLIEEARTNNELQSSTFSDSVWAKSATTVTTGITSPDGSTVAEKLVEDTSTGTHRIITNVGIATSASTDYTISIFAKSAGRDIQLRNNNLSGANFDLVNGTVSGVGSIQAYPNGWYRCTITRQPGTTDRVVVYLLNGASNSYAGDGSSGVYLWGAQHEQGSFATSYIPTTTTALTRNADVATMTGTNFSDWYNASEGSMSVGLRLTPRTPSGTSAILYNGDATGRWSYLVNSSARIFDNTNTATAGNVVATGALNKIVSGFSASEIAIALNGAATATSSFDGTFGPATSLLIGSQGGTSSINGTFAYINYYPQRLTNAEMQAFSK